MAASCLLRSKIAGAVTTTQFTDLLQRTWLESRRFRQGRTTPILPRLAVSGGADSMALAYLCRQWEKQTQDHVSGQDQNQDDNDKVAVKAFVVDHKARKESTREANAVAGWLRGMGIKTQILPLEWPDTTISAFETHARRLRFQALGKACRDSRIEALLLGHHQDDNVETTILRLSSGARGAGLAGIPAVARIPECHGIYGVSESGESVSVHPHDFLESPQPNQQHNRSPVEVSTGGILLCRPLLSLSKFSLVATCQENNVPFVSDPTNFDPTLTPRNAIRSLLSSGSLPHALQNPSILSLIRKSHNLIRDSHRLSDGILSSQFRLLDMSLALGSVAVQVNASSSPLPEEIANKSTQERNELSPQRLHELQSLTLRRLVELVSPFPENHFSLGSYAKFTGRIFPSSTPTFSPGIPRVGSGSELESGKGNLRKEEGKPFTLGGVLFQTLPSQSSPSQPLSASAAASRATDTTTANLETKGRGTGIEAEKGLKWILTRQPFMRHREPVLRFEVPLHPNKQQPEQNQQTATQYTPWTLWDNRFWIRIWVSSDPKVHTLPSPADDFNSSNPNLTFLLRPLKQSDLSPLRNLQNQNKKAKTRQLSSCSSAVQTDFDAESFFQRLGVEAPGQLRFSLPVLTLVNEGDSGGDIPLALPTLGLAFPGLEDKPWIVAWEWKYKMIDLEVLRLLGSM
ncbi:PP-loop family-domain-containing protein [Aspergillus spectabilis]